MNSKRSSNTESKWRIEALDARAGRAFVSWRPERESTQDLIDNVPCLYFSPPFFRPEQVSNISLAWSAGRMSFVQELRGENGEFWFETADEVSEFVRRCYLGGGGGGDGGLGGGSQPPEQPKPEGPRGPNLKGQDGPDELVENLIKLVGEFESQAQKLALGESSLITWALDGERGARSVTGGVFSVFQELTAQKPSLKQGEAWIRWMNDVNVFLNCCFLTGSWRWGSQKLYSEIRELMDEYFWDRRPVVIDRDPFENLRHLPLPRFASMLIPQDVQHEASLFHLLSVFISSPQSILSSNSPGRCIQLLVFAATVVLAATERWANLARRNLEIALHTEMVSEACIWLLKELPSIVFSKQIEEFIADSKNSRYS